MTGQTLDRIAAAFRQSASHFNTLAGDDGTLELIARAAELVSGSIRAGCKVMFCGNGGSAADSQHLAAELLGRYLRNRPALPALALTVDTSALTAIGNDFGFDDVFARQLRGLGRPGDVLFALSTSGNSPNVLRAVEAAGEIGIRTVALTGAKGGRLADLCELAIRVPADHTPRIQELHIAVGHMICELVEETAG